MLTTHNMRVESEDGPLVSISIHRVHAGHRSEVRMLWTDALFLMYQARTFEELRLLMLEWPYRLKQGKKFGKSRAVGVGQL